MAHAQYWLDTEDQQDLEQDLEQTEEQVSLQRVVKLATIRRAVANFVNILTNRNDIPVQFSSGQLSYTDGKTVVIAADDKPEHFDSLVGLALHEGSHILLSNFEFLETLQHLEKYLSSHGVDWFWPLEVRFAMPKGLGSSEYSVHHEEARNRDMRVLTGDPEATVLRAILHPALAKLLPNKTSDLATQSEYRAVVRTMLQDIKMLMNILEDRRIDQWVWRHAGGYRPYYDALYTRYFLTKEIARNLKWNPEWRELTTENYINRILFSFHPDNDPMALPGLPELFKMVDLPTIDRVAPNGEEWKQSITYSSMPTLWQEANTLYAYILRFVALGSLTKAKDDQTPAPTWAQDAIQATSDLPNLDPQMEMVPQEIEAADQMKNGKEKPRTFNGTRGEKLAKTARELTQGQLKKKKAKKNEIQAAAALESAQASMVDLKGDGVPGGTCMVTRKMSDAMFQQEWFVFKSGYWNVQAVGESLARGRRMGQILVHRLQVRNDPLMTKNTRLPHGGLDRRLLAQLGMDITSVFQKSRVDHYKPAMLHLTIDASGSMFGQKWLKVLTVATALAYIGTKMRNVDTVITLRGGNDMPIVCVLFDSRRDQFSQWSKWAQKIGPAGSTPEGLCYKATMELILECAGTHDVYFINFSDGEPTFALDTRNLSDQLSGRRMSRRAHYGSIHMCNYGGDLAEKHTRAQIQMLREHGVKVLSYFIGNGSGADRGNTHSMNAFKRMYGQDASFVNVENATDVLRTLNKLLLARG